MLRSVALNRFLAGLTAMAVALAGARSVHAQWPPESFDNLQVLGSDVTFRELFQTMIGFTRALGVSCAFCHVGNEGAPMAQYDFASDERSAKRTARRMLEMVARINDDYLAGLEERPVPAASVQCTTCHGGLRRPRQLEDVLLEAYQASGIDSTVATYRSLREQYYGRSAYDFGDMPLVTVAAQISVSGAMPDAVRMLELNMEMNPDSRFARTQLVTLSLNDAFVTGGAAAGAQAYAGLRARFGRAGIPEALLSSVGQALLRRELPDAAVAAFQLNVEAHPQSAGAFASLCQGLAARGDVPGAIEACERALALEPDNADAARMLVELRRR